MLVVFVVHPRANPGQVLHPEQEADVLCPITFLCLLCLSFA